MPALEWCKAMTGQVKCSTDEKIRLLRKAMEWQTEIMLETILGHGVDNHLLGLRQIALAHGKELPNIFKDPSYMESNRFRLSTSQLNKNYSKQRLIVSSSEIQFAARFFLFGTRQLDVPAS
ncbi:unnamed protein product [Schistosoma curassoni]|uniref:Choline O-acetyltransferase n=1 Tax=Schistosoma curassoni TaxID=6186 RepID=A0A183L2T6_9TREM|nr:unnamed protein product [Schistosoma curassoni]